MKLYQFLAPFTDLQKVMVITTNYDLVDNERKRAGQWKQSDNEVDSAYVNASGELVIMVY